MTNFNYKFPLSSARTACLLSAMSIALLGCAAGPDFKRPVAPIAVGYTPQALPRETITDSGDVQKESQNFNTTQDIRFDWWKMFQSEALNQLIELAFRQNPSLESAQAALRQAQENVIVQQGFFYPTVGVSYSPSRNKLAGNMGGNSPGVQSDGSIIQTFQNPAGPNYDSSKPFNGPAYYNFHVAQLSLSYVPDFFGLNRRQVESMQAQAEAQRLQLEATYITLAANVVATALQEASLRAQIDAVKKFIAANQENLEILQKQLELGFVSQIDVSTQAIQLAQAEQALSPLQKQLEQTRNLMRALVGNSPDQELTEQFELSTFQLPQALPLSLPSKIVEQRPDVRAAEEQLHAATAMYGVAIANRLPQFSITGSVGGMAANPGWMFDAGGQFFNVTANVAQTIFDGGSLKAKSRAAQQAVIQAGADYRSTVIAALQNVADTLYAIRADADLFKSSLAAEQASQSVLNLTRKQYELGYVSYQTLLIAEQNYQLAAINLVQAKTARLGDSAALYQALGGGWWNRNPAEQLNNPEQLASASAKVAPLHESHP